MQTHSSTLVLSGTGKFGDLLHAWQTLSSTFRKSICDWTKKFKVYDDKIALPKGQTTYFNRMNSPGLNAFYLKNEKKLIILGRREKNSTNIVLKAEFCGLYYRSVNRDFENYNEYQLVVDGFIREMDQNILHMFVNCNISKNLSIDIEILFYFIDWSKW